MQIRVGNLNMMTTTGQLAELFLPYGKVFSARIVSVGPKGRSQSMDGQLVRKSGDQEIASALL
jgi:hypothetical protein